MSNTVYDAGTEQEADDSIDVLHVDDDSSLAEIVATFLERDSERIDVVTETHPVAALERLRTETFDCVVTDYQMPDMNGIEFIRSVREEYPDLPCLIYTGQGSEEVASEAISAGATDYLQKQSGTEQYELLANRIENAVESYRAERRADSLERIRTVARKVNQALVRTATRSEIEARVCDILANAEAYTAVWVGAVDPDTGRIEPRSTAGIDDAYFDAAPLSAANRSDRNGPVARALREGRVAVVDDVAALDNDELRDVAIDYDVHAIAAIPLSYDDELYGPLVVHADRPGTFDAAERALLTELGGDVSHAINAVGVRTALREERDRRAALFENAPNPIVEFDTDDVAVVTDVNGAFEDTFGFNAEEIRDRTIADVLVPEDERVEHASIVDRATNGEAVQTEVQRKTADGLKDFLLTISPIDGEDSPDAYAWYIDITDRKELEVELQEKANLLDHIFGQIPTALYVKDTNGRHVRMSDYDVDPGDALGKTDPEIYGDSAFTRETYADDMRVIETGDPIINKQEYNPNNGEWTLTSKVPWYGDDDEIKGLIGVSRLITEKKEYERELERKNERLENFANVVSHDLRNPLTVASGQLDLVQEETTDDRLDRISDALDRMDSLIGDILTLAQQGWAVEETNEVTLSAVVDQAWSNVETGQATKSVETDCRFEADETRLLQLFENLVRNSVEHGSTDPRSSPTHEDSVEHGPTNNGPEDGQGGHVSEENLTVRVGALEDGFFVADNGPGIRDDQRDRLFELGYTTTADGTGFGLAIVKEIADAHGWEITLVDSDDNNDSGVRFEITGIDLIE